MIVGWKCGACGTENRASIDIESRIGKVQKCTNVACLRDSAINWTLDIRIKAMLVDLSDVDKLVKPPIDMKIIDNQ